MHRSYIVDHLRAQVQAAGGDKKKKAKQDQLLASLPAVFDEVCERNKLSRGGYHCTA